MSEHSIFIKKILRPIRFSTVLDPSNGQELKECIELYTCLWGGKFNSFIPSIQKTKTDCNELYQDNKTINGYINAFEPDFLLELGGKYNDEIKFHKDHKIDFQEVWCNNSDTLLNYGTPSLYLYESLYQSEFKFKRQQPLEVIFPIASSDKFDLFVSACFGSFPNKAIGNMHKSMYKEKFNAKEIKIDEHNYWQYIGKNLFPISVASYNLRKLNFNFSLGPTLFILNATKPEDLFDFWNLRSLGFLIFPIPFEWFEALLDKCSDFIKKNHVPLPNNRNGVMKSTSVLPSRTLKQQDIKYIKEKIGERCTEGFHYSYFPRIWDNWAREKDHASRCKIVHREESSEVRLVDKDFKTLSLKPDFDVPYVWQEGPVWALAISIERSFGGLNIPEVFIRENDSSCSPLLFKKVDSQEGMVFFLNGYKGQVYINEFNSISVFKKWFKSRGIDIDISSPGRTAIEIIRALGSLDDSAHVLDYELIKTLNKIAKGSIEEEEKDRIIPRSLKKRSIGYGSLLNVLKKINKANDDEITLRRAKNHLRQITRSKVLEIGLETKCSFCDQKNWHSLKDLNAILKCAHCLKNYPFPMNDPPKNSWYYRTIGPFSIEDYARGSYTTVFALNHLINTIDGLSTWVPSMESSDGKFEFDFAIWKEIQDFGVKKHFKIFGECKTKNEFKEKDISKMKDLAVKFPGSILVFATLKEKLEDKEKKKIGELAIWGREGIGNGITRAPVFVLTRTELTNDKPIPYCWTGTQDERAQYASGQSFGRSDIKRMCELTQKIYLDIEWFDQWRMRNFKKE